MRALLLGRDGLPQIWITVGDPPPDLWTLEGARDSSAGAANELRRVIFRYVGSERDANGAFAVYRKS